MSVSVLKEKSPVDVATKAPEPALVSMLAEIIDLDKEHVLPSISDAGQARGLNMIRLGGLLERADHEEIWKSDQSVTCDGFLDWCREAHGYVPDQVGRFRKAYRVAMCSGLDPAELSKLDTYKLCRLLPRVVKPLPNLKVGGAHPDNKDRYEKNMGWLDKAKSMSRAELEAAIQNRQSGNGNKKPRKQPAPIKLKADQAETLDAAIKTLQEKNPELKGKHKPHLVDCIVQDWMSYQQGEPSPMALEAAMKNAGPQVVAEAFEKIWPGVAEISLVKELAE